jgi:hypothetical protein
VGSQSVQALGMDLRPHLENNLRKATRTGVVAQVAESLLSELKALSSSPSTTKKVVKYV